MGQMRQFYLRRSVRNRYARPNRKAGSGGRHKTNPQYGKDRGDTSRVSCAAQSIWPNLTQTTKAALSIAEKAAIFGSLQAWVYASVSGQASNPTRGTASHN